MECRMEQESYLLSPVVTKPPISLTSSPKKNLTPSHRALLCLLHQRHDNYLKRNSLAQQPLSVSGCGAESFRMDSKTLAEHVVKKAKLSIKLKRKKRIRRHSTKTAEPTADCTGSCERRSLPIVEYSYHYKQIQKEWNNALQQHRLPPIQRSPSKCPQTHPLKISVKPSMALSSPMKQSTVSTTVKCNKSATPELTATGSKNYKQERLRAEQRSEIYALNAVMKLYEEHKMCSKV